MGAVSGRVSVVPAASVEPIELPRGSWSKLLVTGSRVGSASTLGCSLFTPGTVTALVRHETEETAYVVSGSGEVQLEDGAVPFTAGDALHVPAGLWHAVANTGDEDVVMVFGFPHPDYPPTERR